jgi:hypothetical protein
MIMPGKFSDIESIIQQAAKGSLDLDAFQDFCAAHNLEFDDVCNTIALTIARRFNDSTMQYADADAVANELCAMMITRITRVPGANLPEPAWTIYLAFDTGEWDRGDGSDPVEQFTRPQIRDALRDA